ncbi:PilZ domain-containing protein [Thiorhodovibrio frisius]|uniref:PilZ domain-containing protein n=1 Tax=Thiorhodovibrio frisius TaxID=631362 RepID=H8Z696_9GAMM|nr:PilZ domain-containing protein [Thiorhodovibrio frisius]EIC20680.1 PilZ domain-containing protein [Thiorhodovibrio frisius]WPL21428.1 hypothetical protein Thiofri_01553 [Thiorhodovibrio frisius]
MKAHAVIDELSERIGSLDSERQEELLELVRQWQVGQQRQSDRFEQPVDVGIGYNGRVTVGRAKDLSAGGIFILVDQDFVPTHKVDIVFSLPGAERPFKIKGRVVRIDHDGIAVEFDQVTPYFARALDNILRVNKET